MSVKVFASSLVTHLCSVMFFISIMLTALLHLPCCAYTTHAHAFWGPRGRPIVEGLCSTEGSLSRKYRNRNDAAKRYLKR